MFWQLQSINPNNYLVVREFVSSPGITGKRFFFSWLIYAAVALNSLPISADDFQDQPECQFSSDSLEIRQSLITAFKVRSAYSLAGLMLWSETLGSRPMTKETFRRVRMSARLMAHYDLNQLGQINKKVRNRLLDPECREKLASSYKEEVHNKRLELFDVNDKGLFIDKPIQSFIDSSEALYLITLRHYYREYLHQKTWNSESEESLLREVRQAALELKKIEEYQIMSENGSLDHVALVAHCSKSEHQVVYFLSDAFHSRKAVKEVCLIPDFMYDQLSFRAFAGAQWLTGKVSLTKFVQASVPEMEAYEAFRKTVMDQDSYVPMGFEP